jgi:hypothetical protein
MTGTKVFLLHLARVELPLGFGLGRCLLLVFALCWFLWRHDDDDNGSVVVLFEFVALRLWISMCGYHAAIAVRCLRNL